jgi:pimeloyl-ACP methyl ester carboxylesterase
VTVPLVHAGVFDVDLSEAGAGSPVVALHSSGMSRRQWSRLSAALSATHRIVCPNLLGYGGSGPWTAGTSFTWEDDARMVAAWLGTFDGPVHLVGHSYGGLVALRIALDFPARVRSLALYEPVAFGVLRDAGDAEGLADLDAVNRKGALRDDATGGDEAWLEAFVDYWSGAGAWRALPPQARAGFLAVGRKTFEEVRSLVDDRTPRTAFAGILAPTLLLSGGRSPVAARHVSAILAETMPHATLTTLEDAGHMGPLTHAERVNALVAEFLARLP